MTTLTFGNRILARSGKRGIMKPDSQGRYRQPVGAFKAYNKNGIFYAMNDYLKECMYDKDSTFGRFVSEGKCKAEIDHPQYQTGWSLEKYIQRLNTIDETRVCALHCEIIATEDKDEKGRDIIRVDSLIKPTGMYKNVVLEGYNNPEENVAFSIRSLLNTETSNCDIREIKHLVTWDKVNDEGMAVATKYLSVAMESNEGNDVVITPQLFRNFEELYVETNKAARAAGLESYQTPMETTRIRTEMGWTKIEVYDSMSFTDWR